jgi:hypothetical protein
MFVCAARGERFSERRQIIRESSSATFSRWRKGFFSGPLCVPLLPPSDLAVSVNETGEFIGLIFIGRHHDGEEMEVSFQFTVRADI